MEAVLCPHCFLEWADNLLWVSRHSKGIRKTPFLVCLKQVGLDFEHLFCCADLALLCSVFYCLLTVMQPASVLHCSSGGDFTLDWLNFSDWISLGFCASRASTLLSLCEGPAEVLGWEHCCYLADGKNKMYFCSGNSGKISVNSEFLHFITQLHCFLSRYPTNKWIKLGTFHARDERNVQSFPLDEQMYAKYVKVTQYCKGIHAPQGRKGWLGILCITASQEMCYQSLPYH